MADRRELVLKERKLYVLKDKMLRTEIIQLHHDTPIAGHRGKWKMTELVTRNYWWLGITKDVGQYCYGTLWTIFIFFFFLFSDFIGILFSFSFSFLLDNEEARDKEVT